MAYNVTFEDMHRAYLDCRKHKKETTGAKKFETYAFYNLSLLVDEINAGKYRLKQSTCFVIEYPKAREVFCADFRDRIVQHFVYNELNPVIERLLIKDTASCRVGKGTDYAISRVGRCVRRETQNYSNDAYYLKLDLSGFFMAIDRNLLYEKILYVIRNYYKGQYRNVLEYLCKIIILTDITKDAKFNCPKEKWAKLPPNKTLFGNKYGLAIGNITSQIFANFYLNDIDHFLKSRHRNVVRYVDDIIIVDSNKEKLYETWAMLDARLAPIHQRLNKKKSRVQNVKFGVPFLGVKIYPYYTIMDGSKINRLYYTTSIIKTAEDMVVSASSRKGTFKRYHGYRIAKRWYNHLPDEIKSKMKYCSDYKFCIPGGNKNKNKLIDIKEENENVSNHSRRKVS